MTAQITVAICTYNRYPLLRKLVSILSEQTLPRRMFKILAVDNSNDEAGRNAFAKEAKEQTGLEVVYSSPPGLSRARNVALEKCETEYIAYIDDDALPSPEWLAAIISAFKQSGASVVAGPIEPIWPSPPPDWLPDKYLGCLAILDYGPSDRNLSEYEFAYGTNMAFRASALREVGGFNVGLGRIGSRTLISDEEIETQIAMRKRGHKIFYAAAARVYHRVHENRLSRNYFRARMAWQGVSTLMHDSPLWCFQRSRQEVIRASTELGISECVHRLFSPQDAATFSAQIDLIYHLFLIILNSNNQKDDAFELQFSVFTEKLDAGPANSMVASVSRETSHHFHSTALIGLETKHLFVDSPSSHAFLFNVYADIPGSQMITFPGDFWDRCDGELEYLENSLGPQIQTLTFSTVEPLIYGPRSPGFKAMVSHLEIPVFGILHRLPGTSEQANSLSEVAKRVQIIVLAEAMADRLRDAYGVKNVVYLPLHPTHSLYIGQDGEDAYKCTGALPGQVIFSVIGEARKGKGIELLLAALEHVVPKDREQMFFLFAGRAKDIDAQKVKNRLAIARCAGYVDLRQSKDPLNYTVLTEQEFGQYINITDVGVLLYQGDQRNCMSGILPNYAWGRKPVIVTGNSVVGQLVRKYNLGIVLTKETPRFAAEALTTALHVSQRRLTSQYANESFRRMIATEAVVQRLSFILNGKITAGVDSSRVHQVS